MPGRARETLALRFRQNWLARHPVDGPMGPEVPLDDSLTSLGWLQNLNILKALNPTPPASPEPTTPGGTPLHTRVNPNHVLNMKHDHQTPTRVSMSSRGRCEPTSHHSYTRGSSTSNPYGARYGQPHVRNGLHLGSHSGPGCRLDVAPPLLSSLSPADRINYRTNCTVKPPFSYATLICMAMRESNKSKMTLSGIYCWITENFVYYKVADPSWQVSTNVIFFFDCSNFLLLGI